MTLIHFQHPTQNRAHQKGNITFTYCDFQQNLHFPTLCMAQKLLPGTFARPPTQMTRGLQFKQNCGCLRLHSHLRVSSAWPKLQFCRDNCSKVSNAAPCTPQLPCSELLLFMFRAIQIVRCLCHQFCTVGLLRTKVLTTDFASSSVSQTTPPPSCHHSRQRIL